MNRSATGLLRTFVLAPALAVPAALAAPAAAQTGPATALLNETAAQAAPVTQAVPEPVGSTAGKAAGLGTGAVDGVLGTARGAAPDLGAAGLRSSHRAAPGTAAPAERAAARPVPPVKGRPPAPTTEESIVGQTGEVVGQVVEVLKADGPAQGPSGGAKPPVRGLR
ncbi:hypothetical protein AB0L25_13315 [Spirillospora sp. NPDC052242]